MAAQPNPDDIPPIRISLAESLKSRDGTLTKDALVTNGFVERMRNGTLRVYKRSGLSTLTTPGSGTGFGMTSLVDANGNESLWYATASGTILQYATSFGFTAGHFNDGLNDYWGFWTSLSPQGVTFGTNIGTLSPSALAGSTVGAVYQEGAPSNTFSVYLEGSLAQTYFTSITCNGVTLLAASADIFGVSSGYTGWVWFVSGVISATGTFPLSFKL